MNILLMGVDARPGEAIDIGVRPDALAVLHLDPDDGTCRLLSIPRDSRVDLPGYGMSKINHALAVGGISYERLVVEQFVGITIDRYALIDFSGVTGLVDAVGGVTITVNEPFTTGDYTFPAGQQRLDGAATLAYSRYRGGPDGDFGRERRQQQVLRALMSQTKNTSVIPLITDLLPIVKDHFRSDLSPADLIALASRFRSTCTQDTIDMLSLTGTVATFDDPIFHRPLSYVVIDESELQTKVHELTTGSS